MADIDVTFGSNAPVVTKEIDTAATATTKAAGATVKHSQAVKVSEAANKKLAVTSAAVTHAVKAEAAAHDANANALNRATEAARRRNEVGDDISHTQHEHNHAGWSQAARLGGFRHEMHALEFGQGVMQSGAAGAAVGGAVIGAVALDKFIEGLNEGTNELRERIHADREYIEMVDKAKKAIGEQALGAVKDFGASLIDLTARGGGLKELAEKFARDGGAGGLAASQRAALMANKMFPGHEEDAMRQANNAGSITGQAIDKIMEKMEGMPLKTILNGDEAGRAAVSMYRGKLVSQEEYEDSAARTSHDSTTTAIREVQSMQNKGDISNVSKIPGYSFDAANDALNAIIDPLTAATGEQTKALTDNVEESKKLRESLSGVQYAFEAFKYAFLTPFGGKSTFHDEMQNKQKLEDHGARIHPPAPAPAPGQHMVPSQWGMIPAP